MAVSGPVTMNSLNITGGTVRIQSDAAANDHVLTLTNGGTIASGGVVLFGGDQANVSGNERSLDVRLGGDINTSGTSGGNIDLFGGTMLSSTSTAGRNIYANVRIGFGQGASTSAIFGSSTNTGSLFISGNLSTFGGSRRIDVVSGMTVEASGNYLNANSGSAASLTTAGGGVLKVGGVASNSAINTFVVGAGTDTTTLELTGSGVMSSTGSATGTMGNNFSINSVNAVLKFNSSFAQSATAGVQNFAGVISGGGRLVQEGNGVLALTNNNTYTGTTTVSGGVLQVGSGGVGSTGTGGVTIQNGGTLRGTGTIRSSLFAAQLGAVIQAGDDGAATSFGTLKFTPASGSGIFDFQSGSSVSLGLNPSGSGDLLSFDGLSAGTLVFDGDLLVSAAGFVPTSVQVFNLLDWINVDTVTFNSRYNAASYAGLLLGNGDDNLGFDLPDISGSGYGWDIGQFQTNGTIATALLVPEPSALWLGAVGLAAMMFRRKRRMGTELS